MYSGSQRTAVAPLSGMAVATAGTTIQWPQGFYLFSKVKIITVPPVTDSNGRVACATTSTDFGSCDFGVEAHSVTVAMREIQAPCIVDISTTLSYRNVFSGINDYVQDYFNPEDISTKPLTASQESDKTKQEVPVAISVRSQTSVENHPIISFSTPFVYIPPREETRGRDDFSISKTPVATVCPTAVKTTIHDNYDGTAEDLGYVPQALIDWM
ncbi:MAG: hypothetical protein Q9181_007594, partial [Wetmoreana brouardii]